MVLDQPATVRYRALRNLPARRRPDNVRFGTARLVLQVLQPGKQPLSFKRAIATHAGQQQQHRQEIHLARLVDADLCLYIDGSRYRVRAESLREQPVAVIRILRTIFRHQLGPLAPQACALDGTVQRKPSALSPHLVANHGTGKAGRHALTRHQHLEVAWSRCPMSQDDLARTHLVHFALQVWEDRLQPLWLLRDMTHFDAHVAHPCPARGTGWVDAEAVVAGKHRQDKRRLAPRPLRYEEAYRLLFRRPGALAEVENLPEGADFCLHADAQVQRFVSRQAVGRTDGVWVLTRDVDLHPIQGGHQAADGMRGLPAGDLQRAAEIDIVQRLGVRASHGKKSQNHQNSASEHGKPPFSGNTTETIAQRAITVNTTDTQCRKMTNPVE